jgi:hypothetical protein
MIPWVILIWNTAQLIEFQPDLRPFGLRYKHAVILSWCGRLLVDIEVE